MSSPSPESTDGLPVTVDLRIWGVGSVAPALGRMATGRARLRGTPGLRFAKLLGTGSARTFTVRDADLHHWALLTVFADAAAADRFAAGAMVGQWDRAAYERCAVRMTPLTARGRWSGVEPFPTSTSPAPGKTAGPVAAITRARLRPTRMASFLRSVPPVVADLNGSAGLRLAVGIGEAPVGLQGTFSLWETQSDLLDFAYRRPEHLAVAERTPAERWYAEELFARFAVLSVEGTYAGVLP